MRTGGGGVIYQQGVSGPNKKTLCGGDGMDMFWNQKVLTYYTNPAASSGLICHFTKSSGSVTFSFL